MLRLASVKIASGRDDDGGVRISRTATAVADLAADVVALQEVDLLLDRSGRVDQAAEVGAACRRHGPAWHVRFAAALHGTPGPGGDSRPAAGTELDAPSYGVALLSRWPIGWSRELRLPPARGRRPVPLPPGNRPPVWLIRDEQRVALAAGLRTPDGPLTVVTTHLSFAPLKAAVQLRRVRAWVASLPRPVVLMGDLNLPGGLPGHLTGWTEAVRTPTFPASRPRVQLDHVLVDGPLRPADRQAVVVGGSDHLGLVVDVRLP